MAFQRACLVLLAAVMACRGHPYGGPRGATILRDLGGHTAESSEILSGKLSNLDFSSQQTVHKRLWQRRPHHFSGFGLESKPRLMRLVESGAFDDINVKSREKLTESEGLHNFGILDQRRPVFGGLGGPSHFSGSHRQIKYNAINPISGFSDFSVDRQQKLIRQEYPSYFRLPSKHDERLFAHFGRPTFRSRKATTGPRELSHFNVMGGLNGQRIFGRDRSSGFRNYHDHNRYLGPISFDRSEGKRIYGFVREGEILQGRPTPAAYYFDSYLGKGYRDGTEGQGRSRHPSSDFGGHLYGH